MTLPWRVVWGWDPERQPWGSVDGHSVSGTLVWLKGSLEDESEVGDSHDREEGTSDGTLSRTSKGRENLGRERNRPREAVLHVCFLKTNATSYPVESSAKRFLNDFHIRSAHGEGMPRAVNSLEVGTGWELGALPPSPSRGEEGPSSSPPCCWGGGSEEQPRVGPGSQPHPGGRDPDRLKRRRAMQRARRPWSMRPPGTNDKMWES